MEYELALQGIAVCVVIGAAVWGLLKLDHFGSDE